MTTDCSRGISPHPASSGSGASGVEAALMVALRLALLLLSACASLACGAPSKPASTAPNAVSAQAIRVVPQTHVAGSQYLGLAPGGRFALFSIGAIDLWNRKVAWV